MHAGRDEVDRTLESLEDRLCLRRKTDAPSRTFEAASRRVSKWASPEITTLIRQDHTQALTILRRYRSYLSCSRKRALVAEACLELELHMQVEEETFYPALFALDGETPELNYSIVEHDRMYALIERLRLMSPRDADFDSQFCELIRAAFHHVADEETILLPRAELRLKFQLRELGMKMYLRRLELLRLRGGEAATTTAVGFPLLTAVATAALGLTVWLLFGRRSPATN
jgi:Hemerythrin HHE cation binding domain